MPPEVVFAGTGALFQISHNYIHGVFEEGKGSSYDSTLSKTVPEGKNINFTNGFEIRKNHTVYVSGKLGG